MSARLTVETWSRREVTVDLQADDLVGIAAGHDYVIIRVGGLVSPSGRPTTKSIRIPTSAFDRAAVDYDPMARSASRFD